MAENLYSVDLRGPYTSFSSCVMILGKTRFFFAPSEQEAVKAFARTLGSPPTMAEVAVTKVELGEKP